MKTLIIALMLFAPGAKAAAQKTNTCKCSIVIVRKTSTNIKGLTEKGIYDFLRTFDSSCRDNAEYSEYSNEILFQVLEKYPKYCVGVLLKYPHLDRAYIYNEIKNPLFDYDIKRIILTVDAVSKASQVKRDLIAALKAAEKKNR